MTKQPDNPEEVRPKRNYRSDEEKRRVLKRYDELVGNPEAIGDLLRKEGIYRNTIYKWRKQLTPSNKVGRKPKSNDKKRIDELQAQVAKLQRDIEDYEALTEAQGKVSALLQDVLRKSAEQKPSLPRHRNA